MKQIVDIIKDCRDCPNYYFNSLYPGGIEFSCVELLDDKYRLIPDNEIESDFIHKDCPLEDKE